jgi:hypothetical protein
MNHAPNSGACETAVLWQAVGGKPLGSAMAEMSLRGWSYVAALHGNVSGALMIRGDRGASLYTRRGGKSVGMIHLFDSKQR